MASKSVTCELSFPARRQLQSAVQTAIDDPSTDAFQLRLRAAVAASLHPAADESNVLVSLTSADRVLHVTIIGFESGSHTAEPNAVVIDMGSTRFLANVETRLGSSVVMHVAPVVAMRLTPVPSPPPALPPTPPTSPPPSVPLTVIANNLGTTTDERLSSEMVWVIIVASIAFLIVVGCATAFYLGKRAAKMKKTTVVQVGRPALRRQITPEEHQQPAAAAAANPPQDDPTVRMQDDVRLLELGMAVERSMAQHRQSAGPSTQHPTKASAAPAQGSSPTADIAIALEGVQAAIEDVRESLSPRDGMHTPTSLERRTSMPRSPRDGDKPVETRIRKMSDLAI